MSYDKIRDFIENGSNCENCEYGHEREYCQGCDNCEEDEEDNFPGFNPVESFVMLRAAVVMIDALYIRNFANAIHAAAVVRNITVAAEYMIRTAKRGELDAPNR